MSYDEYPPETAECSPCCLCGETSKMLIPGFLRLKPGVFICVEDEKGHRLWLCEDCQCDFQEKAWDLVNGPQGGGVSDEQEDA